MNSWRVRFWGKSASVTHMRVTCSIVSHKKKKKKKKKNWGKYFPDDSDFIFDWIFIKLSNTKNRHKISEKLDFGLLSTIGMRVTRP